MPDTTPSMRAIVVERERGLAIRKVHTPRPTESEALICVCATSLNRGEVQRALTAQKDGDRPGWDVAGVVQAAAENGLGSARGVRVVGLVETRAWAEFVAVPTALLALFPDSVSFTEAATLPVAGLTALHALGHAGLLLGRRVLVTGATGGVGLFAVQLAQAAGAFVAAAIRDQERSAMVQEAGADQVIVGDGLADAASYSSYDIIVDAVGGPVVTAGLPLLREGGIHVLYGGSGAPDPTIPTAVFVGRMGTSLRGLSLFEEVRREPAAEGLRRLLTLVERGRLKPRIDVEGPCCTNYPVDVERLPPSAARLWRRFWDVCAVSGG